MRTMVGAPTSNVQGLGGFLPVVNDAYPIELPVDPLGFAIGFEGAARTAWAVTWPVPPHSGEVLRWNGTARHVASALADRTLRHDPTSTLTTNTPWHRPFHQHPHHTPHHGAKEARHRTGVSLQGASGVTAWVDEPAVLTPHRVATGSR